MNERMDERTKGPIRETYRAMIQRGLEPAEAANLTAFLHGLPSAGIRWTVTEVEAVVRRRSAHARSGEASIDDVTLAAPIPWSAS